MVLGAAFNSFWAGVYTTQLVFATESPQTVALRGVWNKILAFDVCCSLEVLAQCLTHFQYRAVEEQISKSVNSECIDHYIH